MTEDPRPTGPNAPGGPMSERMQALLSRAAEEQLTEQRQVSAVLADLRGLVAGLGEQLRGTASSARLESLGGDVSSLFTELRMSTSALGERLDVVARRVDEQSAASTEIVAAHGSGNEGLAVRVGGLAEDLSTQSSALDRLTDSVGLLGAFPDSLAALQREVSGLHDRLAPLGDVRSGLADLVARTGAIEALRPEVSGISARMEGLATSDEVTRSRDSQVAAVTERLDRLEALVDRPTLTQQELNASLAPLLARLDDVASGGQTVERLGGLDDRLAALEARLGEVAERLSDVSDAAGGVPAVATDLTRLAGRMDEVSALRADVLATRETVHAMQDDSPVPSLVLGVAALREDVEDLGVRVREVTVPTAEAVATAVGQQVTDRLVDELAPRVADVVLSRVAATLVEQVSGSVTASVQSGLTEKVRAATVDSERRISAHVDEAVLALAEALLRRRRGTRSGASALAGISDLEVAPVGAPVVDAQAGDAQAGDAQAGDAAVDVADVGPDTADLLSSTTAAAGPADGDGDTQTVPPTDVRPVEHAVADDADDADDADAADELDDPVVAQQQPVVPARAWRGDIDIDGSAGSPPAAEREEPRPGPAEQGPAGDADLAGDDVRTEAADEVGPTDADLAAAPHVDGDAGEEQNATRAKDDGSVDGGSVDGGSAAARPDPPAEVPVASALTTPRPSDAYPIPDRGAAAAPAPADDQWDDDDEDGPPRRPWWRPGG